MLSPDKVIAQEYTAKVDGFILQKKQYEVHGKALFYRNPVKWI